MADAWSFYSAGELTFGVGASQQVGKLSARRGWSRVLIVTDPTLVRLGLVDKVRRPLVEAGATVEVFDGSCAEPDLSVAIDAGAAAKKFAPDAICGVGGGSNIDLAKIVAILHAHGGVPADYFSWDNVPGPVTPLIALPTTAGTGSEVSQSAVLTDSANAMKVSTLSQYLRPTVAIVDPLLSSTCPPQVTADSGIDALTHAVEAYTSTTFDMLEQDGDGPAPYSGSHLLVDALAEKAIELVGKHLVQAVRQGDDLEARTGMALAATLAGLAFSNAGVAVVHALEYPIGGAVHCSHGGGNGLLLPYVMRFNLPERQEKFAKIAQLLGGDATAEGAIAQVERLKKAIGIPERLREYGVTPEMLPGFAAKSITITRLMRTNPRRPSEQDLLQILESAL
ncbi:iron-containing alcohol dehydrogenase [Blastopirellula sp. JC732]|uniref:Iron-containing alcohol dehydrogenase n=1 Tax=Blastopirellula sediminis TaxID=2894196 RepID=A0A9X1MPQ2_9BACT|nr:iron-containing alcohol dehydrogenase [Blastopirellula sediminis]MCC9606608.1 iron-containing alcohol dehydrogenase [Blastopirellula sediminis]MCC9630095.1 iron-containing alcohol dehydrogenase [Blastopirellula sediminis]